MCSLSSTYPTGVFSRCISSPGPRPCPQSQGGRPCNGPGFCPCPQTHGCLSPSFCYRSWRPCEIALSASETVTAATSKESHDLHACRGARPLPGVLCRPEERPAEWGPAPPHGPAIPDPTPAAVWQSRPAPPLHHRLPPHAPLRLQDDRGAEQNAGHDHAEAGKVLGGGGEGPRLGGVVWGSDLAQECQDQAG